LSTNRIAKAIVLFLVLFGAGMAIAWMARPMVEMQMAIAPGATGADNAGSPIANDTVPAMAGRISLGAYDARAREILKSGVGAGPDIAAFEVTLKKDPNRPGGQGSQILVRCKARSAQLGAQRLQALAQAIAEERRPISDYARANIEAELALRERTLADNNAQILKLRQRAVEQRASLANDEAQIAALRGRNMELENAMAGLEEDIRSLAEAVRAPVPSRSSTKTTPTLVLTAMLTDRRLELMDKRVEADKNAAQIQRLEQNRASTAQALEQSLLNIDDRIPAASKAIQTEIVRLTNRRDAVVPLTQIAEPQVVKRPILTRKRIAALSLAIAGAAALGFLLQPRLSRRSKS